MAKDKPKRIKVCRKMYVDENGDESRSAHAGATSLVFTFANGETRKVVLGDFSDDVRTCAAWHGLSQSLADAFAGAKGDAGQAVAEFDDRRETLDAGMWLAEREGGGTRPHLLVEAVVAAMVEAGHDAEGLDTGAIREKLSTKEQREGALNNPVIRAHYERIKAERAQARAKAAATAAAGADTDFSAFA